MEKLVRDHIPEIIIQNGQTPKYRIADPAEFEKFLFQKLTEETNEFLLNPSLEELADIYEVLEAISKLKNFNPDELQKIKLSKKEYAGSFEKKRVLQI